jgi:hypothetical protein
VRSREDQHSATARFDVFNGSEDELRQFLVACVPPPGAARSPATPPA